MPDREKVIKGLRDIGGFIAGRIGIGQARNFLRTIDEAVVLLKEQETVEHACDILRANGWKETEPLCSECDAVHAVRCMDCRNAVAYDGYMVVCTHIDSNGNDQHTADWFCADGEKSS